MVPFRCRARRRDSGRSNAPALVGGSSYRLTTTDGAPLYSPMRSWTALARTWAESPGLRATEVCQRPSGPRVAGTVRVAPVGLVIRTAAVTAWPASIHGRNEQEKQ